MTVDRQELKARRIWQRIENWIQAYAYRGNPSAWLRNREGWWVLARLLLLGFAVCGAARGCLLLALPLALYLGADVLLVNTALIFRRDPRPLSLARSVLFTMVGYVSLALAFAPFWLWLHEGFQGAPWQQRSLDAAWQSIRTLTTAGPDVTPLCREAKVLAAVESFVGIYFLSIIIAGYVSWLGKGEAR
jgi:hypothetical protein